MLRATCVLPCLLIAFCPSAYSQDATMLVTGFETLDGLAMTYDAGSPASDMSLNAGPNFVSEGTSSLLLQNVSPVDATGNSYIGVSVSLPEPVSLRGRALAFDAWTTEQENTRALYVRGYDADGGCALSWLTWNSPVRVEGKTEVALTPMMPGSGLAWEPQVAESENRDEIVRLEFIIGTGGRDAPYNIYLDNVRLVVSEVTPFMEIEKVKPLYPQTPLVAEDKAQALIVCPEGDEWRQVARELQTALRERIGAEIPVATAEAVSEEDMRGTQVIALGSVSNNPRLLHLYSHSYTYADDLYPGPGGYVVQSIHDPWGTGRNVLLVGASTVEGAGLGALELVGNVPPDGVAPPMFGVELAGLAEDLLRGIIESPSQK